MMKTRHLPPRQGEDGFVMIIAIVLLSVAASLGAVVMTSGNHASQATGRGRSWVQSLHVAEAGIQDALIRMQATGAPPASFTGSTQEGDYSVTVTSMGRARYQVEAVGTVAAGSAMRAARRVRVTLAPPAEFDAALFSYTSIDTKNNDHIVGDVWANQNVVVDANDLVEGNLTAATGYIHMKNGSRVTKNATSGGYNDATTRAIWLDVNARIDGNALASVTAPTDPVTCGGENQSEYTIRVDGGALISGSATTWGTKLGSGTVAGAVNNNVCTAAPAARPMPVYRYSASNYAAATLHEFGTPAAPTATALTDFNNWLATGSNRVNMTGTFTIFASGPVSQATRIDLSGAKITGDLTLVTNLPIFTNGIEDDTSVTDAIALFASFYKPPTGTACDINQDNSECSIHIKNNFQPSGATAVLVYAPNGPVAIKNNQEMFGAVYAENIQIKNNQELTYDARVNRLVGFGPVTLEPTNWMELSA